METYSDHSAILDYLAQVEQEQQLRESLKSKSGIAALRVEKGKCPRQHSGFQLALRTGLLQGRATAIGASGSLSSLVGTQ